MLADIDDAPDSLSALIAALVTDEPQLAVREGVVSVPRIARAQAPPVLAVPSGAPAWRLRRGDGGALDELHLMPEQAALAPLAPGEVRVAIGAAGINFRDVVVALGLIPTGGGADLIGTEGAGVVLEVGSAVEDIEPGDRVMGMIFGAFGPLAVVDRRLIVAIPDEWPLTQAASLPSVFLTALYGLQDLAGLAPGERLLVHAATGGVGIAAIQLARHLGVEVYATASRWKWDLLRAMGLPDTRIASSRDLGYAAQFREATGGQGVDVILNSLVREHVDASLQLLRDGGRFIEMGKTDIRDPADLALAHPRIAYRAFDLPEAGPERIQELLQQTLALFAEGAFAPLPLRTWDVRRAPDAFRFMSQARHTGKVVLTIPPSLREPGAGEASEGTALITGGTGELGALLARHLVGARGMRSIVLGSRRGTDAPGALELQEELEAQGAEVRIVGCDVCDRDRLQALIDSIPARQPLRTLIHCAAVLDDGVIGSLGAERVERVLAPKLDAAWHLHELTAEIDLREFVLFSSIASTFGTPGQGAYAAANAFLDALAVYRRTLGLPATSIAWGGWEQRSELTAGLGEADLMRMRRAGLGAFSNEQGLSAFEAACGAPDPALTAVRLDMGALRALARQDALPALMRQLVRTTRRSSTAAGGPLLRRLAGVAGQRRRQTLLSFVCGEVATVLGHASAEAIDAGRAFKDLGFDSLTALELRNRMNAATGLRLPATLVFDQPTPGVLADHLLGLLDGIPGDSKKPRSRSSVRWRSRSRSSAWAAASLAACALPRSFGSSLRTVWTQSARCPPTATGSPSSPRWSQVRWVAEKAASSTTPPTSTPPSSASARGRRSRWTRSSGCCSKPPGRPSSTPASIRTRCVAARPACSRAWPRCHMAAMPPRRRPKSRASASPGCLAASPPAGSPTPSGWRGRPSRSTPPAPRRWSRCTSPAARCARASARSRSRAARP